MMKNVFGAGSKGWGRRLAVAALGMTLGAAAQGQTVTLTPVADATIYSAANRANGAGTYLFAGRTDESALRRGLLRFDLSSIPAGSTVTSATLTMFLSRARGAAASVGIHRVLESWNEGPSNAPGEEGEGAPAQAGDVTWSHRVYTTTPWGTAGGVFTSTASATTTVNTEGSAYSWSSPGMAADVQAWLTTPASNFGWLVRGNETTNMSSKRFDSRENPIVANRPRLVVNYTAPAATGACCVPGGGCQILTSAACTAQGGAYRGDNSACTPNPCAATTGACCLPNNSCQVLTSTQCTAAGGVFQSGARCRADFNQDGTANSQDFFDFLSAFFAGNADFNNSGFTDSQDFFDFLSVFFAGC